MFYMHYEVFTTIIFSVYEIELKKQCRFLIKIFGYVQISIFK